MLCPACNSINDADARFCADCGKSLADQSGVPARKKGRPYLIGVLIATVIVIAAAGYYKFILPDGIAAIVNDEKITLSELDAAVARTKASGGDTSAGLRHQVLNDLIVERLVLREAQKAGIRISGEETAAAVREAQAATGLDDDAFTREIKALYGSVRGFEKVLERRLIINRYLAERVVPRGSDPQTAAEAVNLWLRNLSARASVRIALAENLSGPGCSCCRQPGGATSEDGSKRGRAAEEAGLRYWYAKHGPDDVTARLKDFGCHIQVDILKNEKTIGSLRYQDGNITEM